MYYHRINNEIKVGLSVPQFAEELFIVTDRNREYLKTWLPWLDTIQKTSDTREFLVLQLQRFSKREALRKSYHKYNDHIVYGKLKEEIFC
jgi:ribosomal-protein-serine acetyltransferase